MKISDRALGYAVLAGILAAGLVVTVLMVHAHQHARHRITVIFDELGSLQPEDQVTIRGYPVGRVYSVEWEQRMAKVVLEFDEPVVFHEGCRVVNENYSMLGERRVEILDDRQHPRLADDYVFTGEFRPGIAEALHLMVMVGEQVNAVRQVVNVLAHGDSSQASVQEILTSVLTKTEQTIDELDRVVTKGGPALRRSLQEASVLSRKVVSISGAADTVLSTAYREGGAGIASTRTLLNSLQSNVVGITLFLDTLQQQPFYHELIERREVLDKLLQFNEAARRLTTLIDDKGVVLLDDQGNRKSLVTLKNINLFGATAREKARKREKTAAGKP